MRVDLGPVSTGSAQAWVSYATDMLTVLRGLPETQLPSGALDAFGALLSEWRPIADSGEPFRWSIEEQPERVQYLLNALYLAGTVIEQEAASGRACLRPASADKFHLVLVHEALAALAHESRPDAQFVDQMRNVWEIARRD